MQLCIPAHRFSVLLSWSESDPEEGFTASSLRDDSPRSRLHVSNDPGHFYDSWCLDVKLKREVLLFGLGPSPYISAVNKPVCGLGESRVSLVVSEFRGADFDQVEMAGPYTRTHRPTSASIKAVFEV